MVTAGVIVLLLLAIPVIAIAVHVIRMGPPKKMD